MMPDWSYLAKTPLRWWRTRGFGIHSPFAFWFVNEVVRERYAYYAYEKIAGSRATSRPCGLSFLGAKGLFRVAARLDCREAVIAGCGENSLAEAALSQVRSDMRVWHFSGRTKPVAGRAVMLVESADDVDAVVEQAVAILSRDGVVVVRNLRRSESCRRVEQRLIEATTQHGARFSSGHATVFVGLHYLQPQCFVVNLPF